MQSAGLLDLNQMIEIVILILKITKTISQKNATTVSDVFCMN